MVKNNSVELYLTSYINLIKKAGSDNPKILLDYIKNANIKDRTKHNYLNAIVSLQKHNPDVITGDISALKEYRDTLQKSINESVKEDNITEKQREVMDKVSWKDILSLIDKLKDKKDSDHTALEEYILLSLMNPPLRNDLQEVRVAHNKKDCHDNCVLVPKKGDVVLYIRDHKTTSRGGKPIIRELDNSLGRDVRQLVSDGRSHLFVDRSRKPYTSSAFTHMMNRIFKKHIGTPVSSTLLRKIYLTDKYSGYKKKAREMAEDAEQMGHSVATQQTNYVDGE
jgi:hypothetical protein